MYREAAEGENLDASKSPPRPTPELFQSYLPAALASRLIACLGVDRAGPGIGRRRRGGDW
jgi:hypothetical protein